MSWRDQLRKASFRGVEFLFNDAGGEFGRRNVTHQYPLRDKPYVEDLGRKARQISLEAFVLSTPANGYNYMPGRDALIDALEKAGPGVLVHPTLGELRVSVLDSQMKESSREGGMARFTLSFIEAGEATFPSARANTPSIVNARATTAEASVVKEFAAKFSVTDKPAFVTDAATQLLTGATTLIGSVPKLVPIAKDALAEFSPDLASLVTNLPALVQVPNQLGQALFTQIDDVRRLATDPKDMVGIAGRDPLNDMKMLRKLFDFGNPGTGTAVVSVPLTTPSRVQQAGNQAAIVDLVQRSAVIAAVRASSEKDFDTFQDAAAVRTELADRIDMLLLATNDNEAFDALVGMRSSMVLDLTARGADLARLVNYTPAGTVPALAIAYDLYEDASRDQEIVSRNRVDYPGFVRGGRALQVLADA